MSEEVREDDEWLYEGGSGGGGGEGENNDTVSTTRRNGDGDGGGIDAEKGEEANITDISSKDIPNAEGGPVGGGTMMIPNDGDGESEDEEDDEDDSDDDDDGVQVVIGDTKSSAASGQIPFGGTGGVGGGGGGGVAGVKRSAPLPDKKGKFSVEDFDTPGMINGVSALEYSIDGLEEKPWRKPGADITDYFNYGFTEETWRAYTERQKRMRFESGGPQILNPVGQKPMDTRGVISVAFGGHGGGQMGHNQMQNQRMDMMNLRRREEPRENTIQVMTADRREYSRKNFEMGVGPPMPPTFNPTVPPPNFPPPGHGPGPEFMNPEFFNHPPPQYYPDEHQGYEEQWMDHHTDTWDMGMSGPPQGSSAIVSLTKVPNVPPPPGDEDVKHERKD